jgi:EmrB/QacA subfamily drug resistance transporter
MSSALTTRRIITLGVLGGAFLAAIEATIVSTVMPTVVAHLGGLTHYAWVFSAYILTSTVTMPLWGRLSDLYGRRTFYLAAVGLFLLGSALSGASQSMAQLIAFRAVQGLGAGGLLPLGMVIIGELYTLKERAKAQALFSSVWGLASIVGPLLGGFIADRTSWRWVFYLNLPFGAVAATLVGMSLVDRRSTEPPRIDYRGAAALSAAVTLFLLALTQTGVRGGGFDTLSLVVLYAAATIIGLWFLRIERRVPQPILPLDLLTDRHVGSATVVGFLTGIAMFGAISFVPLFVQTALGRSATQAGSALTPLLLGWVTMSAVTSRILPRVGFRRMVMSGLVCVSIGFMGLLTISHSSSLVALYVALGIMGLGMGMTMLSLLLAQQAAVTRDKLGIATSLGQFSRSIGGAVGVALMGTVLTATLASLRTLPEARAIEVGLHRAFVSGAVVSVLALVASAWVPPGFPQKPLGASPAVVPDPARADAAKTDPVGV